MLDCSIGGITIAKLQALQTDALSEALATPGITRQLAFDGDGCRILRARSDPRVVSGWHHHGDYDVYGYVVTGSVRLENDQGEAIRVGEGGSSMSQPIPSIVKLTPLKTRVMR